MAEVEYPPFNPEDSVYQLSEEEIADYNSRKFRRTYDDIENCKFTCPLTLKQVWKEIDNVIPTMDLFNKKNIRYISNDEISDKALNIFMKELYSDIHSIPHEGDLVLGVYCTNDGPVEIIIRGNRKVTKQCYAGFNMFAKDEVIPIMALYCQEVFIPNEHVKYLVCGNILDFNLRVLMIEFYASPNSSAYIAKNGVCLN